MHPTRVATAPRTTPDILPAFLPSSRHGRKLPRPLATTCTIHRIQPRACYKGPGPLERASPNDKLRQYRSLARRGGHVRFWPLEFNTRWTLRLAQRAHARPVPLRRLADWPLASGQKPLIHFCAAEVNHARRTFYGETTAEPPRASRTIPRTKGKPRNGKTKSDKANPTNV